MKRDTAGLWHYCISGLEVWSEVELPGAIPTVAQRTSPEVLLRRGYVPSDLREATTSGPNWMMTTTQFLLQVPDVVRFLITEGRQITFTVAPGVEEHDALIFLLGSAFGILLHQRGLMVLHASAVAVGGKAVLFCGRSGAGKSTLAAGLGAQGYPFMTDDICVIGFDASGAPIVHPDGRLLKLWAQAVEQLALDKQCGAAVRSQIEKYYVTPAGDLVTTVLPAGAIYHLRELRAPYPLGIERLPFVDASAILRLNAYRVRLITRMRQEPLQFQHVTQVVRRVGVFHLTRPLDFEALPDVIAWLTAHWRELRLLEAAG
jgi:hypothetical protein